MIRMIGIDGSISGLGRIRIVRIVIICIIWAQKILMVVKGLAIGKEVMED